MMKDNKKPLSPRRKFLLQSARSVGIAGIAAFSWGGILSKSQASSLLLRPPGAQAETDFVKTCIKCGLCVEACPYDTLSLAKLGEEAPLGTPYFTPRETPCYLCEDIPCTNACPTTSLDIKSLRKEPEQPADIMQSKMGLAIVDTDSCIAYWGIQCDACYRACPLLDEAITIEYQHNTRTGKHAFLRPIVHADKCTGCGKCEHACVTQKASIFVLPLTMVRGETGSHYVRGWLESEESKLKNAKSKINTTDISKQPALDTLNDTDWMNNE